MTEGECTEDSSARNSARWRTLARLVPGVRTASLKTEKRKTQRALPGFRGFAIGLSHKARWLLRGLRWRVISLYRKGHWASRRFRGFAIGLSHKARWLLRGLRWRVISLYRKGYWACRRGRRYAVNCVRRFARLPSLRSSRLPLRLGSDLRIRELVRGRAFRVARVGELAGLLVALGVDPERASDRRVQSRVRAATRRALLPAGQALHLVEPVVVGQNWNHKERSRVEQARSVTLDRSGAPGCDPLGVLLALVPPLLSGRPLVDGDGVVSPAPPVEDVRHLDEVERMHLAYAQFRSLFVESPGWLTPRIAVVLSSNRPQFVAGAISQIQAQRWVELELVLGLHGVSPPDDLGLLEGGAVTEASIHVFKDDVVFGDALQELTAKTTSEHLAKWDDDDLYGPHHLLDLWLLHVLSGAAIVGKAAEFVLLEEQDLVVRRRGGRILSETSFLAGGALLVSRVAFDGVGGWSSLPRSVDQDLIGRLARSGHVSFRSHGLEFVLTRRADGHTWPVIDAYFVAAAELGWGRIGLEIAGVETTAVSPHPSESGALPSLAMCVPNKNDHFGLERLEAVASEMHRVERIVVADDRSQPPLQIKVGGPLELTRVPDGPGFGAGRSRHHAAARASEDVLVFADADVHVTDEALAMVQSWHRERPAAVHAVIEFADFGLDHMMEVLRTSGIVEMERSAKAQAFPGQRWRELYWTHSGDYSVVRSGTYRSCVGGFLSVDASVYAATGGFRDVPVRGVEDIEFGYRLLATGCRQRLYRGPGVIHLGQRTFASNLIANVINEKDRWLSRLVPVWAPTLEERGSLLFGETEPIVPFIAGFVTDEALEVIQERFGKGVVLEHGRDWDLLTGPFCVTSDSLNSEVAEALPEAYRLFRNGACGEVVVMSAGREIARIVSLWAINHCLVANGRPPWIASEQRSPLDPERKIEDLVRDRFGSAFIVLGEAAIGLS